METSYALVDKDTPPTALTKTSPVDGRKMQLVFSDEFERDDRTFWPVSRSPIGFSFVLIIRRETIHIGKRLI
jgi:hypothetical protein